MIHINRYLIYQHQHILINLKHRTQIAFTDHYLKIRVISKSSIMFNFDNKDNFNLLILILVM